MAKTRGSAVRNTPVCARFTDAEVADMDARRGSLSRSDWMRFLNALAKKNDTSFVKASTSTRLFEADFSQTELSREAQ